MTIEKVELRKVRVNGHSKSVVTIIPKKFADVLSIKGGDYVKITLRNKTIILEKFVY